MIPMNNFKLELEVVCDELMQELSLEAGWRISIHSSERHS